LALSDYIISQPRRRPFFVWHGRALRPDVGSLGRETARPPSKGRGEFIVALYEWETIRSERRPR
jgi:hypothetical protein